MTREQWIHVASSLLLGFMCGVVGYALLSYYDAPEWARIGVYYTVSMNTYIVVVRRRSS